MKLIDERNVKDNTFYKFDSNLFLGVSPLQFQIERIVSIFGQYICLPKVKVRARLRPCVYRD